MTPKIDFGASCGVLLRLGGVLGAFCGVVLRLGGVLGAFCGVLLRLGGVLGASWSVLELKTPQKKSASLRGPTVSYTLGVKEWTSLSAYTKRFRAERFPSSASLPRNENGEPFPPPHLLL